MGEAVLDRHRGGAASRRGACHLAVPSCVGSLSTWDPAEAPVTLRLTIVSLQLGQGYGASLLWKHLERGAQGERVGKEGKRRQL